jgi:hypothetical protein
MERSDGIDDVLRRAAAPTGSQPDAAADAAPPAVTAREPPNALDVVERSMQLLAAAQVKRRRLVASLMLMSLHVMTILSPKQLAQW